MNPLVPSALDGMVLSLLAANPDHRFANARILLRDLQRLEEGLGLRPGASAGAGEPIAATVPPRVPEPAPRTPARPDPPAVEEFQHRGRIPGGDAFYAQDTRFMNDRVRMPERSSGSRTPIFTTLALVLAVLSIGLTLVLHYSPDAIERLILASRTQEAPVTAPATAPAPLPSTAPPVTEATQDPATPPAARKLSPPRAASDAKPEEQSPIASAPLPQQPLAAEPNPSARTLSPPTGEPEQSDTLPTAESQQSATGSTAPPQEAPPAPPTANVPQSKPRGTAKLNIDVSPRGEIYVDGEHYGTTPPITTLDLEPGMHRIEIRNGSRKPYLTYMTVEAGDQRRIRHDFSAKPSRPPG